jgi:transposase-like protein
MGVARPKRSFDREFKLQVVRQLLGGEKRLSQLCREHQLSATLVRRWQEQYEQEGEAAWPEFGSLVVGPDPEQRIRELEAALGRAHLEIELLRRAVKQAEKGGSLPRRNGQ